MFSSQDLYAICMQIFEGVAVPVSWFVLPLFLVRVVNGQISGDAAEIRSAVKGLLLYFVLLMSFGFILEILLQIPQSFIPEVSTTEIVSKTQTLLKKETGTVEFLTKSIPDMIFFALEALLALIYWAVLILHILVTVLLVAMAPIIFLLACILNVGIPVRLFFSLLIMSSCWPAMWYGFDKALPFIDKIIPNEFGKFVLELVLTIIKGIGPAAVAYMSLNSGPGKAVVGATEKLSGFAGRMGLKGAKTVSSGAKMAAQWGHSKLFKSRTEGANSSLSNEGLRTYTGGVLNENASSFSSKGSRNYNNSESRRPQARSQSSVTGPANVSQVSSTGSASSSSDSAHQNISRADRSAAFQTSTASRMTDGGPTTQNRNSRQGSSVSPQNYPSSEGFQTSRYPRVSRSVATQVPQGDLRSKTQNQFSKGASAQAHHAHHAHSAESSAEINSGATWPRHQQNSRT